MEVDVTDRIGLHDGVGTVYDEFVADQIRRVLVEGHRLRSAIREELRGASVGEADRYPNQERGQGYDQRYRTSVKEDPDRVLGSTPRKGISRKDA
ncbi:hypothetical protein QFW96_15230 [Saccharopolyspora sp. TS4A08]|uniref:Uncharacterized protein n=1 Tax=Saccharopolyspora ipomoeae TaxID=3042027 RepID=A0ABT6PPU5_9PSEU|nr:hypothetical protein [Saccharopolyspora sp. TS4A08]MDI2029983.1 hypothetical protein [Saccharopolyspora sp. TS4A08]